MEVSEKVQALIDRAVHLHKKSEPEKPETPKANPEKAEPPKTMPAKSKPLATPVRSAAAIPVVAEPPESPKLSRTTTDVEMGMADAAAAIPAVEQAGNPKASPMSIASTPMKSPVTKKMKGDIGSTQSLASSIPSLPSFSGSSTSDRRPHHSDSATTLSLAAYMQSMRLQHEGPMAIGFKTKSDLFFLFITLRYRSVAMPYN